MDALSQRDQVLHKLYHSRSPVQVEDMRNTLDVPRKSLATILWELDRDGWVEKVGGKRGNYRYKLTEKGRNEAQFILRIEASDPPPRDFSAALRSESETAKLLARTKDFEYLRHFMSHLFFTYRVEEKLQTAVDRERILNEAILTYLKIDPVKLAAEEEMLKPIRDLSK